MLICLVVPSRGGLVPGTYSYLVVLPYHGILRNNRLLPAPRLKRSIGPWPAWLVKCYRYDRYLQNFVKHLWKVLLCFVTTWLPNTLRITRFYRKEQSMLKWIATFVQEWVESDEVQPTYIGRMNQIATLLTKSLGARHLRSLLVKLGMQDLHTPTWGGILDHIFSQWSLWLLLSLFFCFLYLVSVSFV